MSESLDSAISLTLGNVPEISEGDPQEIYEALSKIHQAIEILVSNYDSEGGTYVTIGTTQTINGGKTFTAVTTFSNAVNLNAAVGINGLVTFGDANNIAFNTATGTKLGTAVTQKLGFWNKTPVVQPAATNQAALTNSTGGTRDGTLAAVVGSGDDANINNNFTDIHTLLNEIRTALVNTGIIKGSA